MGRSPKLATLKELAARSSARVSKKSLIKDAVEAKEMLAALPCSCSLSSIKIRKRTSNGGELAFAATKHSRA